MRLWHTYASFAEKEKKPPLLGRFTPLVCDFYINYLYYIYLHLEIQKDRNGNLRNVRENKRVALKSDGERRGGE